MDSHQILDTIFNYSAKIAKERDFIKILTLITNLAKDLVNCDRCTIWLLDNRTNELWTKVADGLSEIRIPKDSGIVGASITESEPIIINEPYSDFRFNKKVDQETKYLTKSILVIPIYGLDNEIIGVFQAINKLNEISNFCIDDINRLTLAASFASKVLDTESLLNINNSNIKEQKLAREKQLSMITNDFVYSDRFDYKIVYKASDILAGDSYSLFKTKNGNTIIYVLDAMGHGLLPSLTSFAIASAVKQYILTSNSFEEFADSILHTCQSMLSSSEQLSCTFIYMDSKLSVIKYFIAGMYPVILQDFNQTLELKSNNPPIMSFTKRIKIDSINLRYFKKLLIYSDGLVENEDEIISYQNIKTLLNPFVLESHMDILREKKLDDDVTVIYFEDKRAIYN